LLRLVRTVKQTEGGNITSPLRGDNTKNIDLSGNLGTKGETVGGLESTGLSFLRRKKERNRIKT
jgi:hypothetical protein